MVFSSLGLAVTVGLGGNYWILSWPCQQNWHLDLGRAEEFASSHPKTGIYSRALDCSTWYEMLNCRLFVDKKAGKFLFKICGESGSPLPYPAALVIS